jgi:hypothetical protein
MKVSLKSQKYDRKFFSIPVPQSESRGKKKPLDPGSATLSSSNKFFGPVIQFLKGRSMVDVPCGCDDGAGEGTEVAHAHEDEELTEGARHTKGGNLRKGS